MATKRVSPGKRVVRRKSATASEPAAGAALPVNDRRQLVAAEAYFLAERRGFVQGHELEDWTAAEAVVDSRLQDMQVA